MPKQPAHLRRWLILLALVVLAAGGVALRLSLQRQAHQRQVEACRSKRAELARFRSESFDSQLAQMRKLRLNPEQIATLRRVDPAAYARYAQAFGDQVDRVAQAADRLGALVDDYRAANCLAIE